MRLDAVLKRYFALVVLALIALAAYFQASGVAQCVGSRLAVDANALAAAPLGAAPPGVLPAGSADPHSRTAEAIVERNPFDSVTGPLKRQDAGEPEAGGAAAPVDFSNPYAAQDCTDTMQLLVIAASEEAAWSMAVVGTPGQQAKTQMRRIGDALGAKRVWFIAWDRIWLQGDGELCQVRMFKPAAVASAGVPPPAPPAGDLPKPASGPSGVPSDIASKIQRVSANEFNVDRSVVDKILENQAELMRSARIVPEQENGKVVGIRLFGIRPDTLLGTLGMENGDRLESINGFNMASPEKALEAYARLRTANHLTVALNRRGKPTNIDFNIK
jgi:general secretion pathway protein C